jgi:hypothetical protein
MFGAVSYPKSSKGSAFVDIEAKPGPPCVMKTAHSVKNDFEQQSGSLTDRREGRTGHELA